MWARDAGEHWNYTWSVRAPHMTDLQLPLDNAAIERILPHRFPFLLVDRIIEFEPDQRIVGIKNISDNERSLSRVPGQRPALPPTLLTEAVAQVGAILILGFADDTFTKTVGFVAMVLATANVVGGWFVTDRMLEMFKRRPEPKKDDET